MSSITSLSHVPVSQGGELPSVERTPGQAAPEFVYAYLKELIILLKLAPGAVITEMAVAEATHVSRTPVREAFLRLSGENLLHIVPRRGAVVAPITLRQLREFAETRAIIEEHAARVICQKRLDVSADLHVWIERQAAETESASPDEHKLIEADRAFHQTMVAAIGNTELANVYRSLGDRQMRTGLAMFRADSARKENALAQHFQIYDALKEWELDDAIFTIHNHLVGTLDGLETYFTN